MNGRWNCTQVILLLLLQLVLFYFYVNHYHLNNNPTCITHFESLEAAKGHNSHHHQQHQQHQNFSNDFDEDHCSRYEDLGLYDLLRRDLAFAQDYMFRYDKSLWFVSSSSCCAIQLKVVDYIPYICYDGLHAQYRGRGILLQWYTYFSKFSRFNFDFLKIQQSKTLSRFIVPDLDLAVSTIDLVVNGPTATICQSSAGPWMNQVSSRCILSPDHTSQAWGKVPVEYWPLHVERLSANTLDNYRSNSVLSTRPVMLRSWKIGTQVPSWENRIGKLIYRGNPDLDFQRVRHNLYHLARSGSRTDLFDVEWVKAGEASGREKFVGIEESCSYRYHAYSDGSSASARLKYLLSCGGIVFFSQSPWEEYFYGVLYRAAYRAVGSTLKKKYTLEQIANLQEHSPLDSQTWDIYVAYDEWKQQYDEILAQSSSSSSSPAAINEALANIPLPMVIPVDLFWQRVIEYMEFFEKHPDFAAAIGSYAQRMIRRIDEPALQCYWRELFHGFADRQRKVMGPQAQVELDKHCMSLQSDLHYSIYELAHS